MSTLAEAEAVEMAVDLIKLRLLRLAKAFPQIKIRIIGSLAKKPYRLSLVNDLDIVYYTNSFNPVMLARFKRQMAALAREQFHGLKVVVEFRDGPFKPAPSTFPVLQIHAVWHYRKKKLYKWLRDPRCLGWYIGLITKQRMFFIEYSVKAGNFSERFVTLRPSRRAFTIFCTYTVLQNTANFVQKTLQLKGRNPLTKQLQYFINLNAQLKMGLPVTAATKREVQSKTLEYLNQMLKQI